MHATGPIEPTFVRPFGLAVAAAPDGFLVTDGIGQVHELSPTARWVLDACAVPSTAAEVADLVGEVLDLPAPPADLVAVTLEELVSVGLLVCRPEGGTGRVPQPRTDDLEVRPSPGAGRGVFARRAFAADEVVERFAVIVVPAEETAAVQATRLGWYVFAWEEEHVAVGLGFGSLYNHSPQPNARWWALPEELLIELVASRPIEAGEEVLIDYAGGEEGVDLGFEPLPT